MPTPQVFQQEVFDCTALDVLVRCDFRASNGNDVKNDYCGLRGMYPSILKTFIMVICFLTSLSPAMLKVSLASANIYKEALTMRNVSQKTLGQAQAPEIIAAYQSGKTARTIAGEFNTYHGVITEILKSHGVEIRHKRSYQVIPQEIRDGVVTLYTSGQTSRQISAHYSISKTTVLKILSEQRVAVRPACPLPSVFCDICGESGCRHLANERNRRFRAAPHEKNKVHQSNYRQKNLEYCRARRRQYYKNNKANENAKAAEWKAQNLEKVREAAHKRRIANPEKHLQQARLHRKKNKDTYRLYVINRRALKKSLPGNFTVKEWVDLCNLYENKCLRCGKEVPLTVDHIIPITRPGSRNDITNIQPLCKFCNTSKLQKIIDFRPDKSCLLNLTAPTKGGNKNA